MIIGALTSLISIVPVLIAWIIGLALAARELQRRPRMAKLAIGGLVILIVERIFFSLISIMLPMWLSSTGIGMARYTAYWSVIGIARSLVEVAGWVFILMALFARQSSQPIDQDLVGRIPGSYIPPAGYTDTN